MNTSPRKIAWISEYPLEWMPDAPESVRKMPKGHPATWMAVLKEEFQKNPSLELHILVLRNNIERDFFFERDGVKFHVLKVPRLMRAPSFFLVDTIVLRRALRLIQPDLVHAWGTERGAALVASRLGYPFVVTIQGLLTWYRELIPFSAYDRFATLLEQVALRRAQIVTTESTFAVNYLKKRYPALTVCQAEHAPNWLFHRIPRKPQTKPVRFIAVGTLDYRKGSDLLLRGLNQLVAELPFELLIIGGTGGKLIEDLRPQMSAELWRRVQFKSKLRPEEVAFELSTATIKVLPTRADTSPNAVKEAVVAGVPVVASSIGGIPDYVNPDQNGLLFESEDLAGLVQALRNAVQHPLFGKGLVDSSNLSKNREYLSPQRMNEKFLASYDIAALLQNRRSTKPR